MRANERLVAALQMKDHLIGHEDLARDAKFGQFQQFFDTLIVHWGGLLGSGDVCFPEFAEESDPCQVGSKSFKL